MDTGRIHYHKEVNFMKKFNFSKGLIVGLLTFALCIVAFAAVGAKADEQAAAAPTKTTPVAAEYDATNDTVTAGSNAYVYVVKAASGNKIKAGQAATGQMATNKISIADLGIKGTNKDVFLYVCNKEAEVEETVAANLTIKGNANKVVGVIDYTQADVPRSADVISAYYVDKATKKQVAIASAKLYWSADQDKWYQANSLTESTRKDSKNQATADGFLGTDLSNMLEAGGTIYIKQAGVSSSEGAAQFGSKVAKVKIAKQAKAPKAKIDVAKDTIALKNGFDFSLAVKTNLSGDEYVPVKWFTILPNLKTATFSDAIIGGTVGTGQSAKVTAYKPLDKKNTNAGKEVKDDTANKYYYSYTSKQVKTLSIDKMFEIIKANIDGGVLPEDFKIAIRKSATEKKPASAYTLIDLGLQDEAPIVWTKDNVEGEFLIATADEFTKKGLTLGDIKGFAGYTGTSTLTMETTGFDQTFAFNTATANTKGRDEGTVFEYAVVATADYAATGDAAIDWTTVKWKKFDPSKLKITEKLSGKYSTVKGTKKTATLASTATGDISDGASSKEKNDASFNRTVVKDSVVKENTKALLLIRRQGDKASSKRASKYIALYVAKEGKEYNLYSTVSNGQAANKVTIYFAKYNAAIGTEGQAGYKAAGFYIDESIAPVTKWTQKAQTGVALEALTDAEYWKAGLPNETTKICALTDPSSAANQYKPEASATEKGDTTDAIAAGEYKLTGLLTDSNNTLVFAIREYANIKVNAVYGTVKNTTFTPENGKTQLVAEIKKGKACTAAVNAQTGAVTWTDPIASAAVVKYVGDAAEITFGVDFAVPSGYAKDEEASAYPKVVAGDGYTIAETGSFTPGAQSANPKVKITAESADAIEVTVDFAVYKTYTISFDYGTDYTGAKSEAKTTNKVGKITLPSSPTMDGFTFEGWFDNAGLTGDVVTSDKPYTADTTLYAKWTANA